MFRLLAHLVALESPSTSREGVNAVAAELTGLLAEVGFEISRSSLSGFGDQVTAVRRFGRGPNVLVLAHTDTVWPRGTADSWPYSCSHGAVSGPGAGDMKSSLVMVVYAIRALSKRDGGVDLGDVRLLLVPDEELGSPHSRRWIEDTARLADVCLGLEPGRPGGGVVVARGAVGALVISARGVSAHATEPGGRSALATLAPLVARLEGLSRHDSGTTVTVGMLHGGTARQVVPDYAEMHVDLRAPTDAAAAALLAKVQEVIEDKQGSAGVMIDGGITRPAFASHGGGWLFELVTSQSSEVGLGAYEVHERGGGDSSFAGALGIPTLDGLGPLVHHPCSRREWVDARSVVTRGAVFASLLEGIAVGLRTSRTAD